jgi:hypothetical protein
MIDTKNSKKIIMKICGILKTYDVIKKPGALMHYIDISIIFKPNPEIP